jgi:c-di-GMP-binding flagellar brake protein YcgR
MVGQAWGTLGTPESLQLRNVGRGGALIEGPVPYALGTAQTARLVLDHHASDVQVRVCHVTARPGAKSPRYLIGLEFLDLHPATQAQIDRLVEAARRG